MIDTQEAALTATPVWLDTFVCQYQMTDTTCCPESIFNANRSTRWNQSITVGGTDLYSRDSDQLMFRAESPPVEHEPILAFAQECLDHYVKERKQAGAVPAFGMGEGYNVLRYKPGDAYHAVHSDAGWPNLANRHLTFGLFLNTIPTGGELEFPEQGVKVAPVEGRGVIFPAAWMYAHRSLPATVDRYVFNVFYGFLPQP
tara:strand:+ start:838 stop:1437 length:600 start_codon:yes stop_codon:yes gene_type:complete